MKKQTKKNIGQALSLGGLVGAVILFVVAILVTSLTADVVQDVKDDQTADTAADNVSRKGLEGMQNLGDQYANIGTVIGAVVIIGLLLASFSGFMSRR